MTDRLAGDLFGGLLFLLVVAPYVALLYHRVHRWMWGHR